MIGKLNGCIESIDLDHVILDVGGVGYVIYCSSRTMGSLQVGTSIKIFTHMTVKEEQVILYGFLEKNEKEWFLLLQTVQGVGAKMALNILSCYAPNDILNAVLAEDVAILKIVSGIGPKLATRIVNELKTHKGLTDKFSSATLKMSLTNNALGSTIVTDALSALVNLGYNRKDAYVVISQIQANDGNIPLEELIRRSLNKLSGA